MSVERQRIEAAIRHTIGNDIIALLDDDSVIEVMRNANGVLCVERLGKRIEKSSIALSDRATESLIKFLASESREVCNDKKPSLAVKLPYWHARFQGLLPPIVEAPSFSIRKHSKHLFTLESYVEKGELNQEQYDCLIEAVDNRENILISGGTGSGKTTLANALLQKMVATGDRIITIEDTPELRLEEETSLQLFTRDIIGYGPRHALKDILRLRPDRIVVGELRDGACLDLVKAWNTGHSGGFTTIHANSCELALHRVESLIAEVAVNVPRELIAQTINIVVQIKRQSARRFISDIKRLTGLNNQTYSFCNIRGDYAKSTTVRDVQHCNNVVHLP